MKTITCPKCNEVVAVPDHKDFVICCNEVIYVPDDKDVNIIFNELLNPSESNETIKKAAARYKKINDETHDNKDEISNGIC